MHFIQVSALVLQSDDIHVLAGSCSEEGKRGKGILDDYFQPADVQLILKQAAEKCYRDAKDRGRQVRAAMLAMVAGDFRLIVEMLSVLMSPDVDVPQNQDKVFWYGQAKGFYDAHLAKTTYVATTLEKGGQRRAVDTLKAMMELHQFFCFISARQFHDAWSILDRLNIVPKSMAEIAEKGERYRGLDPLLQQRIPSVLLSTMRTFHLEHNRLKAEMNTGSRTTVQSALAELKERTSVVTSFAGVIGDVPQVQLEEMARLDASMI